MTESIRALIVEDENGAYEALKLHIEEYTPEVTVIGRAASVAEGTRLINELKPELVFLDIRLPDGDGFGLLDQLEEIKFEIIFTTAFDNYRDKAFDYFALQYLLKPIDISKLEAVVARYKERRWQGFGKENYKQFKQLVQSNMQKLPLPVGDGYIICDIHDIIRLEADSNYTKIFLIDKSKIMVSKTLKFYNDLLEGQGFFRIHKTHLINIRYVSSVRSEGMVTMKDGSQLSVSQRSKSSFMKMLKELS